MNATAAVLGCILLTQLAGTTDSVSTANEPAATATPSVDVPVPDILPGKPRQDAEPAPASDVDIPSEITLEPNPLPASEPKQLDQLRSIADPPTRDAAPDAATVDDPAASSALPAEVSPGSAKSSDRRGPLPPEMVAELLTLPSESRLVGRPLTLYEALSPAQGQLARKEVVHAYWRLVQGVGQYRVALAERELLNTISNDTPETAILRAARTSANAAADRAELLAMTAQYELAAAALLSESDPLPLPADVPHVGPYRTYFDELFSQRIAPSQIQLVDRTMPLARRAIDLRAESVNAAERALQAAIEAYRTGQCDIQTLIDYAAERSRQQQALLVSVCRYNHDIADYALAVISPQASPRDVVAMLITTARDLPEPSAVEQASTISPLSPGRNDTGLSGVGSATMNGPAAVSGKRRPTLAPPKESLRSKDSLEAPQEIAPASAEQDASPIPPAQETPPVGGSIMERPMVPITDNSRQPSSWVARRPMTGGLDAAQSALGLYPALVGKAPAVQAKRLAAALHWIRTLPEPSGNPITLEQCLSAVPGAERQNVIEKYWLAAQKAAEYQALVSRRNSIAELEPFTIDVDSGETASEQADRLQVARNTADADLLDAQGRLLESQLELTLAAGRPSASDWLLPTTQPHCGPYQLKLDAQPRDLVTSWSMRRLTATIPGLANALNTSASAVVEADAARAALGTEYQAGTRSLDQVLEAIENQTRETLSFLDMLSAYNRAIGRYAIAVLPDNVSADQLVATLVLE